MKNQYFLLIIILMSLNLYAFDLSGVILDMEENLPLPGANIQLIEDGKFTFSNEAGEFTLRNLETHRVTLKVSFIGYKSELVSLDLSEPKNFYKRIYLSPSVIKFEAVRVTITKSDIKLSNSSLPIVTYDDNQIERTQPLTVSDAIAGNPGITLASDGIWGKTVSIRGLSKNNIVTLIDGNRISTATNLAAGLSLIDIHDIEKIETIKSGASSLYGSGATGGVINVITKKAAYNDRFYIKPSLKIGFNTVNAMHYENLSFLTGSKFWNMKLAVQNRIADDAKTPKGTLENSQFKDKNISANFNLRPLENHEISFHFQTFNVSNVGIPGGKPLFPDGADVTYLSADRDLYSVQYTVKSMLPMLSNLSMKLYKQDIFRDVENIPYQIQIMPTTPVKEIHVDKVAPVATHETIGFHLQSNWILSEHNYLTTGIDGWQKSLVSKRKKYLHINLLNPNHEIIKTIEQTIGELPLPQSSYATAGIFISDDQFLWDEKIILNIGGRLDFIKINSDEVKNPQYQIVDGVRTDNPPTQVTFWEAEDDLDLSWSANLGLSYKPAQEWCFKINLSRSFRSPTLEERFDYIDLGSLIKLGDPDLNSESSFAKDLGVKYVQETFSMGANLFHNQMTDLVIEKSGTFNDRNALIKTNAGSALLYGYELFGSTYLPFNFSLSANIAYVYGQDNELDQPLATIPPLNGQFFINYRIRGWATVSLETNFFADQTRIADWEVETPGYTTYNFYLYTSKFQFLNTSHQLSFRVDNISDKAFRNHLSTNRGAMQFEPGRNFSVNWQTEL
ncbi:MAG: TonB-dependent receptor [Candidatus Marinimicrobia bacterium]|nr:TonB-dependent receptor [Candidatus Neomarinimicrobiota bacterium]